MWSERIVYFTLHEVGGKSIANRPPPKKNKKAVWMGVLCIGIYIVRAGGGRDLLLLSRPTSRNKTFLMGKTVQKKKVGKPWIRTTRGEAAENFFETDS